MFGIGIQELIVIALVAGVLLFVSKRILDVARSFGRFTGEFKKSKKEIENEIRSSSDTHTGDDSRS